MQIESLRHTFALRTAAMADLPAVERLLAGAGLPTEGLGDQFGTQYVVAESGGEIIATEGLEVYGEYALLRSAVVEPTWRGQGVGAALTRDRVAWAAERGIRALYLLTTTAPDFFSQLGFERVERSSAPEELHASREFASICPGSAVVMRLTLPATKDE